MNGNILLTMNIRKHHSLEDTIEQNYISYFGRLGFNVFPLVNAEDFDYYFDNIKLSGIVLTGGIDVNNDSELSRLRDSVEYRLLEYCIANSVPVLGICRGMHLIISYFGGTITLNIPGHVANRHQIICDSLMKTKLLSNDFWVNSFHNHGVRIADSPSTLHVAFLTSEDGLVEGIYHDEYPVLAIQWHPEREQPPNEKIDSLISSFLRDGTL